MKKILAALLILVGGQSAFADTCGTSLTGVFTSFQATRLCSVFGSAVNHSLIPSADNTYDLGSSSFGWRTLYADTSVITPLLNATASQVIRVDADAQRLFTFDASSDTDLTLTFGDGGTTAAQNLTVKPATADGDDDAYSCFASGSACSRAGGGYAIFNGNEVTSVGGNVEIGTGAGAADTIDFAQGASGLITARIDGSGISLPISGDTLLLQEATAGDKCMGSLTLNGATPVVTSTTCALTASRIFLTRTSIDADTTGDMAVTAISNGVSFSVTSEASDTATVNWLIINEAA